jgi:hypothetical protein
MRLHLPILTLLPSFAVYLRDEVLKEQRLLLLIQLSVIAYHLILRNTPYSELGASYFEGHEKPEIKKKRLIKQLEKRRLQVSLQQQPTIA